MAREAENIDSAVLEAACEGTVYQKRLVKQALRNVPHHSRMFAKAEAAISRA